MDSVKLKQFVALAETLHFGEASRRCHVSPSTLSRCITQLEQELHITLFNRDNRTVTITEAGKQLLTFAKDSLMHWQALKQSFAATRDQLKGALSFYCSVTASYSFLYEVLKDFRRQHPLVEIRLHTGDPAQAIERVTSGQEDISIAARQDLMPKEVQFKRMTFSPLVLIQPAELAETFPSSRKDPSYWHTVPFILSERGVARERIDAWFKKSKISPNIYAQVAGHEAIVSMVSLGFGVGLIPQIVLENSPLANKVKPVAEQPSFRPYEVGLCVLEKRLKNPLVKAFWEQAPTHS